MSILKKIGLASGGAAAVYAVWWWHHADQYAQADLITALAAFAGMAITAGFLFSLLWLFRLLP
jgi:hypothetical protein